MQDPECVRGRVAHERDLPVVHHPSKPRTVLHGIQTEAAKGARDVQNVFGNPSWALLVLSCIRATSAIPEGFQESFANDVNLSVLLVLS